MPRRNNRKRLKREGSLGFNPSKYIGKAAGNGGAGTFASRSAELEACEACEACEIYEICINDRSEKPYYDRHKAHSYSQKQRRAMNDIRRMQKSAEKVRVFIPTSPTVQLPEHSPAPTAGGIDTPAESTTTTILGGIVEWLRKTLHA